MKNTQSTSATTENPSFIAQMSDPLIKIGEGRSLVETIRMAHFCGKDNPCDVDFDALEEVARMASNQIQDALEEIEEICKKQATA